MVTTHDTPGAALTAALTATGALWSANDYYEVTTDADEFAAAILAAMPDWTLVPRKATADWTGSTRKDDAAGWPSGWRDTVTEYEAEIARLRQRIAELEARQ